MAPVSHIAMVPQRKLWQPTHNGGTTALALITAVGNLPRHHYSGLLTVVEGHQPQGAATPAMMAAEAGYHQNYKIYFTGPQSTYLHVTYLHIAYFFLF